MKKVIIALIILLAFAACRQSQVSLPTIAGTPAINPDYAGVTIPPAIAPLNFEYLGEEAARVYANGQKVRMRGNLAVFGRRQWKKLLSCDTISVSIQVKKDGKWQAFQPFEIYVSKDAIDPYVSYRLIPPGYQGWQHMGIYQRELASYREGTIMENSLTGGNCMNCHTPSWGDPDKFVFHVRAAFGGTILRDGDFIEKLNTKTDSTISALVYPFWHPDGKLVAFSTNKTLQVFHAGDPNRIEVYDEASDVVVYDTEAHEIVWSPLTKSPDFFETFPSFSPDGKWLYFCSAAAVSPMPDKFDQAKYGIYRIAFDAATRTFGDALETVFDAPAMSKSASFPRVSPDGKYLCFTLQEYGNFPIWHQDADLWILDLASGEVGPLEGINSDSVDSFHTWSSNSRWMVFSSRRDDKLYTKLYIGHIDENGQAAKPFLLPQKDPVNYYKKLIYSYNLPQFMSGKVRVNKRRLLNVIRNSKGTDIKPAE
ncbi:MAG: PD40 domain-containing protein [Bacteroidales bacterium]|nr:PD40 domain-containing protein [Bacteroidales bacterium]